MQGVIPNTLPRKSIEENDISTNKEFEGRKKLRRTHLTLVYGKSMFTWDSFTLSNAGWIVLWIILIIVIILCIAILMVSLYMYRVNSDGWKEPGKDVRTLMSKSHVVIYPHTSYSDFFVAMWYRYTHDDVLSNTKFLVRPQLYDYTPFSEEYINSLGGVRASSISKRGGGTVDMIVERLKDTPIFHFAMSPKGTVRNGAEWRSGYWWIAKRLNIDIAVVGLNYKTKRVELAGVLTPSDDRAADEKKLKRWIASIPQK